MITETSDVPQQQVEEIKFVPGKVVFGARGFSNPTPVFITWIFRTEFVVNKVFLIWLSSQDIIDNAHTLKVILGIVAAIDGIVWGLGKFVGITKDGMEK